MDGRPKAADTCALKNAVLCADFAKSGSKNTGNILEKTLATDA